MDTRTADGTVPTCSLWGSTAPPIGCWSISLQPSFPSIRHRRPVIDEPVTEINPKAPAFKRGMHGAVRAASGQEEPGAARSGEHTGAYEYQRRIRARDPPAA